MALVDMTNAEPMCLLSMLAKAAACEAVSPERDDIDHDTKRARTCTPFERTVSPAGSTSSSTGCGVKFLCKQCGRGYANTDAARKHARQNHPEWLKEQGQGCPSLYCTAIEPEAPPMPLVATAASAAACKPRPLAISAASGSVVPPPAPSPAATATAHLLMCAASSCYALSMAAHVADDDEFEHAPRADGLATLLALAPPPATLAGSAGAQKRPRAPRTVRCGKCEACERDDCGTCKNCVDMPRFGGLNKRKQGCVHKVCCSRVLAAP